MHEMTWDAERYARNARFVADLGMPLLDLLQARPGERILDLGCGDGALTEKLAASKVRVVGVDASPAQVQAACARGLDARCMDARALAFDAEFDAVLSNAALHWMREADRVIDGVWRALRPGGRFVAECGAAGNVQHIRDALHGALERRGPDPRAVDPWYFPVPEDYRLRLERRGFRVRTLECFPRPTVLPGDLTDWLETFAGPFLATLPSHEHRAFIDEVAARLRPALCGADGRWTADYVRLRFVADRPGY